MTQPSPSKAVKSGCDVRKLVLTIDGRRLVFAAPVPAGKDPMEMTLGEWMRAPVLSANALLNDFVDRYRAAPPSIDGED